MRLALSTLMALLILSGVIGITSAAPKELKVLTDCPTIQGCIDKAEAGDTITVPALKYVENLQITKAVTLQAAAGTKNSDVVIQAADESKPTILIADSTGVTVQGFTITGGDVGTLIQGQATATAQNNLIQGNREGVAVDPSAQATLTNNQITQNDQDGIVIWGSAQVQTNSVGANGFDGVKVLGDAQISNNNITGNGGHGIFVVGKAQISGNTVSGNQLEGVEIWGLAQATIEANKINKNARGVVVWGTAQATLSGNEITQNQGDGVLLVDQGRGDLRGNKILNNGQWGVAIWVESCHAEAKGWSFLGVVTGADNELAGNPSGDLCGVPTTLKKTG